MLSSKILRNILIIGNLERDIGNQIEPLLCTMRVANERELRVLRSHTLQWRDVVHARMSALCVQLGPCHLHERAVRVAVLFTRRDYGQEKGRVLHIVS